MDLLELLQRPFFDSSLACCSMLVAGLTCPALLDDQSYGAEFRLLMPLSQERGRGLLVLI